MEFSELVKKRRSCRGFDKTPVSQENIDAVLEAAQWAPSPLNMQPFQFITVTDTTIKSQIQKLGLEAKQTVMNNNGPSHVIVENLTIGTLIDPEDDGQPTANANGDDVQPIGAPDDEDGVQVTDLVLVEGTNATVTINVTNLTTGTATLYGWIDFNGNGLFEIGERASVDVLSGADNLPYGMIGAYPIYIYSKVSWREV